MNRVFDEETKKESEFLRQKNEENERKKIEKEYSEKGGKNMKGKQRVTF